MKRYLSASCASASKRDPGNPLISAFSSILWRGMPGVPLRSRCTSLNFRKGSHARRKALCPRSTATNAESAVEVGQRRGREPSRAARRLDLRGGRPHRHTPVGQRGVGELRVRVIALENLVIALLAEAGDRQITLAREMAAYVSPRPGFTHHPLTVHAAVHMIDLVERAGQFRSASGDERSPIYEARADG